VGVGTLNFPVFEYDERMNFSAIPRETFLGRVLRLPLRLIPERTQVRVLQGPLRGKKWLVGSGNHGCWLGSYEYSKQRAFSAAIRPGDVVYDLGSNVGFYTLLASVLSGPRGRVFSFEPVPENLDFLRKHLAINNVTNCTVYAAAVGAWSGTANFLPGAERSSGRLDSAAGSLAVTTLALDDLVAGGQLPLPSVIKCEIEGGEFEALKGAAKTLATAFPAIFLATHGAGVPQDCCGLLHDLDYQLSSLDGNPIEHSCEILAIPAKGRFKEKEQVASRSPR
jgi:FkbM family methyltransferase